MTDKFDDMAWEFICVKCGLRYSKKLIDCKTEPHICDKCSSFTRGKSK